MQCHTSTKTTGLSTVMPYMEAGMDASNLSAWRNLDCLDQWQPVCILPMNSSYGECVCPRVVQLQVMA